MSPWRRALVVSGLALIACAFGLKSCASVDRQKFARAPDTVLVVDRGGAPLRVVRVDGIDRRWIELRQVSPHFIAAVLAAEDARFASHQGVDYRALSRAFLTNLMPWRRRSGASTITQQVVKLVYGRPSGLFSKATEIVRARELEGIFSKDEILEQYVNRIPFGDRIEGVERASEEYFGTSAAELTVGQAALLAGIPQAPSVTEPRRHFERALRRRNEVLERMRRTGAIDDSTYQAALAELPTIRASNPHPNEAPRFVEAALSKWREAKLERDGIKLTTSLDLVLQHRASELLESTIAKFSSRGVENGAAVVLANDTGEILAYVGAARSRATAPGGSLDLLARRRQPGSALKPFVYELLFEKGGTAATVLDDSARAMTGADGRLFEASDYDGRERGPVRARVALSASLNLAALDAAARVGSSALVARLSALGFRNLESADHYGAAAVLGGLDVSPLDLAHAYATLARGGSSIPLSFGGKPAETGRALMKPDAAAVTIDILSDAAARREGFGADLTDVAGLAQFGLKTGTSSGWRDAWAVAFTSELTVTVWLGDPAGKPLASVSGFEAAAPVAARILRAATELAHRPRGTTAKPAMPLLAVEVCSLSGLRPGADCRHVVRESFVAGTVPVETCNAHGHSREPETQSLVIVEPHANARLLVDPARSDFTLPLRATLGKSEITEAYWEVDGAKLTGNRWPATRGRHRVVATYRGIKSEPTSFAVEIP